MMREERHQEPSPSEGPIPRTVEVFRPECRLGLYGVASATSLLKMLGPHPRVFVLGLERLTALDSRCVRSVQLVASRCRGAGTTLLLCGTGPQARATLARAGLLDEIGPQNVFLDLREALVHARICAGR